MNSILILGTVRSGTSMLTGMFANAWFYLGENPNYLDKYLGFSKSIYSVGLLFAKDNNRSLLVRQNNVYQFQILQDCGAYPPFQVSTNYNVIY